MIIPDYIVKNSNLNMNSKFLYALILEHQENGVCIESKTFFACFFGKGVTIRTINNYLKELKDNNIIFIGPYKSVRNAIFILNSMDYSKNEPQKIEDCPIEINNAQNQENIFSLQENTASNGLISTPNTNYTKGLSTLVLVSNKNNKNIYIQSARVREEIDNSNIFDSYERLQNSIRAPVYDEKSRAHYTKWLFKDFFSWHTSGKLYDVGIEIVDTMIEAVKKSNLLLGFKFDYITYNKNNPFSDLILNITESEFASIVDSVAFKEDIENRPAYIIGAIVQAGKKISWKKADELVRKGWPWSDWTPSGKYLSNTIFVTQQRIEKEKQYLHFKQEFENKNLRRKK